ncbi:MAG: VOC family protein [Candidatus Cybelea sp.]
MSESQAPFRSIDHVQLAIPLGEEPAARRFYVDTLGMREVPKPPELRERGGLWCSSGDVFVHLGVDSNFRSAKTAHPAFCCPGYDALLQRARSLGAQISDDGHLADGRRHCYIADPFGNRIELIDG